MGFTHTARIALVAIALASLAAACGDASEEGEGSPNNANNDESPYARMDIIDLVADPSAVDGVMVEVEGVLDLREPFGGDCVRPEEMPEDPELLAEYRPSFSATEFVIQDEVQLALVTLSGGGYSNWSPPEGLASGDRIVVRGSLQAGTTTSQCTWEPVFETLVLGVDSAVNVEN